MSGVHVSPPGDRPGAAADAAAARPAGAASRAARSGLLARLRAPGWGVALAVSAVIAAWQWSFTDGLPRPRAGDEITASVGLLPDLRYFFYFYYHLGLFPVGAHEVPRLGPSRHDALEFVARHGGRLRMDFGDVVNTPRYGDFGKLFVLVPDALLRGDPGHATARPFNQLLFVCALLCTWWAFWRERRAVLGALIVVLVGSDPFQLVQTYVRANIFALPISVALIALATQLPYLTGRRGLDRRAWVTALLSGVVLATVREIRSEAAVIGVSLLAIHLALRAPWPKRAALALVFLATWGITGGAWTGYWSRGFERAARFVGQAGGHVYHGRHGTNHALWHALYCGLGDYGGDRGFVWDDREAFRWSVTADPATNPRPLPYHYREGYYFEETYPGGDPISPTDVPEYNALVRARVLGVIRDDPPWYARILLRRAGAILGGATPASLSVGVAQLRLPGAGWLLIPILLLAWRLRRAFEARLVLFTLPLSAVALFVYSGRGTTNYGIAHLIALAVVIDGIARARRPAA